LQATNGGGFIPEYKLSELQDKAMPIKGSLTPHQPAWGLSHNARYFI